MCTADTLLGLWKNKLRRKEEIFFRAREKKSDYRALLQETSGDRVVALIAHDKQKVAMSQFVMEHAEELREYFDYVLATDSTGKLARKALQGCRWTKEELKRILLCNSGPEGGDVEIAALVIHGHCRHVFFFQDPATSHPHEADIRLFEQAIPEGINARMASNPASAKILLDSVRREAEQKRAYGTPNLTGRIRGAEAVRNGPSRGRARQRPTR